MIEKLLPVKVGSGVLDRPMTRQQAERWGRQNMPSDLKAAGFTVDVYRSSPEINGGDWFRVSYTKRY